MDETADSISVRKFCFFLNVWTNQHCSLPDKEIHDGLCGKDFSAAISVFWATAQTTS